ncbi:MAG: aspartyl protease family protein [Bacteroidales bacterium]|jgi:hypothetical protein|nr:aspartyl protease family protein [Bacteroidales bacterium]
MMTQRHYLFAAFAMFFFTVFLSSSFAQSKKEIKEFRKLQNKYLFTAKLKNKHVAEKIRFTSVKNAVIVPVKINGKIRNFIFDTGAITVFSDSLAKELEAAYSFSIPVIDAAGIVDSLNFYNTDNVCLENICFDNVAYGVANLDAFERHSCMRIDGLFGSNILRLLNWEIDFSNQILCVSDKAFSRDNYNMEIPFRESQGSRTPEIRMEMGEFYFYATLDLGNNDLIQIPDSLFFKSRKSNSLKYAKGEGKKTETLFNDEAVQTQYLVEIDTLYMGNNRIMNEPVNVVPSTMILIGNAFLIKYGKIAINWKQKKLFLEKKEEDKIIENEEYWEFTADLQDDELIICFIRENTHSHKNGIRPGDRILSVNGISTEKIDISRWCEIKENTKELKSMPVEILTSAGKKTIQLQKITDKSLIENVHH